jgi:hypothetical protein
MARDIQYDVGKLLLSELRESGFALAGGRALRELDLTARPTRDLDLFTKTMDVGNFADAVDKAATVLTTNGYAIVIESSTETFARLRVADKADSVVVELGYDYREYSPVELEIGTVLDERDAILNKVSALYARSLPRDFIDVYSIRLSGRMSDAEILTLSRERDEGFILEYFSEALRRVEILPYEEFVEYGITKAEYIKIKQSMLAWIDSIDT